jgi:hypothetical protein
MRLDAAQRVGGWVGASAKIAIARNIRRFHLEPPQACVDVNGGGRARTTALFWARAFGPGPRMDPLEDAGD